MIKDMSIMFTCPKCGEENVFKAGIPERNNIVSCPSCGKPIVIGDEFFEEFERIMDGLGESIEHFAQQ
jgi:predicted RNA-binding Zn-ribbon protein involved in translation (DUF1610 family)